MDKRKSPDRGDAKSRKTPHCSPQASRGADYLPLPPLPRQAQNTHSPGQSSSGEEDSGRLYQVSRRTAVPSAGRSRRYGVSGVPSRQANFPPVGTSSAQLASRALPPVPAPTPEPEPTGNLVVHAPLGCPDPQPSTTVSLPHGDPMEMLSRVHTRSPWGRETVVLG